MDYEIIYSKRKTLCLQIKRDGRVIIRCPYRTSKERIESFYNSHLEWVQRKVEVTKNRMVPINELGDTDIEDLKSKAWEYIPNRVDYFASIMGVTPANVSINRAKTRFGSCNSKKRLNFSCNVMRYPIEAIDYVIVHELAHIKELNHSKRFWAIVENVLPDYKERQKILKTK
ncbi:MAG: M48 family metallopeptidase [Clostridia bacterium]|nr:M48 family metallopeptidase [Clostridia bacterium]